MGIAGQQIGRGWEGTGSFTGEHASELFSKLLDGRVSDLELGAFAIAIRTQGETVEELAGFAAATREHGLPLVAPHPAVLLPYCHNGMRRVPILTPLPAMQLAEKVMSVHVHGPLDDPSRATSAKVIHGLGLPMARDRAGIEGARQRHAPVFVGTEWLCPPLARLLSERRLVGHRSSGHTVAKLLGPLHSGPRLRVVDCAHCAYARLLPGFAVNAAATPLLMRSAEGWPATDVQRLQWLDVFVNGTLSGLPLLPRTCGAATAAIGIQSVNSGKKPASSPLTHRVELVARAVAAPSVGRLALQTA